MELIDTEISDDDSCWLCGDVLAVNDFLIECVFCGNEVCVHCREHTSKGVMCLECANELNDDEEK